MAEPPPRDAYINFEYLPWPGEAERAPVWQVSLQFDDHSLDRDGPEFTDASDAVRWAQSQGAKNVFIDIEDSRLWAGRGDPPADWHLGVFSHDDPRGRPEGAIETVRKARDEFAAEEKTRALQLRREIGSRLRRRREGEGLSIPQLAHRVGVSPEDITEIEEGLGPLTLTLAQWTDLVWATRSPWPDERRYRNTGAGAFGWTAHSPLEAAEYAVRRHLEGKEDLSSNPLARWTYDVTYTFEGTNDIGDLGEIVKAALDGTSNVVASEVVVQRDVSDRAVAGTVMAYTVNVVAKEEATALGIVQGASARALSRKSNPRLLEPRRIPRYLRDIALRGAVPLRDI